MLSRDVVRENKDDSDDDEEGKTRKREGGLNREKRKGKIMIK